MCASRGNN